MTIFCPLCGASAVETDARHLWRCQGCASGFLHPQPSDDELAHAYASAYGNDGAKFIGPVEWAMEQAAKREAETLQGELPVGAKVLDVGAGRGLLSSALATIGFDCTAVERSPEAAVGMSAHVKLVVAPSLAQAALEADSFDLVIFRHVLEHLRDPVEALVAAKRLLRPTGRILIEVPNFGSLQARVTKRHWFHLDLPRHLFQFTQAGLEAACRKAGLSDVVIRPGLSVVQDPIGWIQSALHMSGTPHQRLYQSLHRGSPKGFSLLVDVAAAAAMAPAAIGLSALEFGTGSGGVLRARASSKHASP